MYKALLAERRGIQIWNGDYLIREFGFPVDWSSATTEDLLTNERNAELWQEVQQLVELANLGAQQQPVALPSELLEIAAAQQEQGKGIKITRINKARSLLPLGLIDAKKYIERHFENGGRGALIK